MNNRIYGRAIIILKYIFIALILTIVMMSESVSLWQVVVLLLFITTNQIRNFFIKKNIKLRYFTYIVEYLLSIIVASFIGKYGVLGFLPLLLDIAIAYKSYFSIMLIILIMVTLHFTSGEADIIFTTMGSFTIVILGSMVTLETSGKVKAQNLYDKLRISEEELKKANIVLENYANTVEELAILRERNRISREIHDNVGHSLSTINIQLGAIEKIAIKDGNMASEMAKNLGVFTRESLESVRATVRMMRPREFEEYEGIIAISEMIKNFEKLSGIVVQYRVSDNVWKINSDQTMVIYRLVQEFLSNAIRHGKATKVRIFLNFLEDSLRIQLRDNGIGCNKVIEGVGLKSIAERVEVWGGHIEYHSGTNEGFELIATMDRGKLSIDEI